MTIKAFWLQGAAAAAFVAGAAIAVPATANPIPPAATYADLLEPVPDAGARLAADDAMTPPVAHLELAQYQTADHHHHHHHHHSWRWYRDNGYYWTGSTWVVIPNYNHHHHERRWYYDNGYTWDNRTHAWTMRNAHHHHHHHHSNGM